MTRANVLVKLTNPESGYESEIEATVSPEEWVVMDRVLCGHGQEYTAAPELLEALRQLGNEANDAIDAEDLNLIRTETLTEALQAISKATNPQHKAKA